jgi:hypothetical protein
MSFKSVFERNPFASLTNAIDMKIEEIPFASLTNAIDMKIERVLTGFLIG